MSKANEVLMFLTALSYAAQNNLNLCNSSSLLSIVTYLLILSLAADTNLLLNIMAISRCCRAVYTELSLLRRICSRLAMFSLAELADSVIALRTTSCISSKVFSFCCSDSVVGNLSRGIPLMGPMYDLRAPFAFSAASLMFTTQVQCLCDSQAHVVQSRSLQLRQKRPRSWVGWLGQLLDIFSMMLLRAVTVGKLLAHADRGRGGLGAAMNDLQTGQWKPSSVAAPRFMAASISVLRHISQNVCEQGRDFGFTYWARHTGQISSAEMFSLSLVMAISTRNSC